MLLLVSIMRGGTSFHYAGNTMVQDVVLWNNAQVSSVWSTETIIGHTSSVLISSNRKVLLLHFTLCCTPLVMLLDYLHYIISCSIIVLVISSEQAII